VRATRRARRRRVAVVTGTRAEYGLLRSTMEAIERRGDLALQVVVTGMHLLPKFGRTADEIRSDGFRVHARIPMQRGDDRPIDQAAGLARGVQGIARFLLRARTDIVVVLGDRIEALAGALAGVTTGKLVAHIHGGDRAPGDFDDSLRHAISKLAHLHLTATEAASRRLIRMGEAPERVHRVGAPGLDRLRELAHERRPGKRPSGMALVVQHPCGRSAEQERQVMARVLEAVRLEGLHRRIVYPNSDRGHGGILAAIRAHGRAALNGEVETFRSLPRDEFLRLLLGVDVIVGNSSSGVIEAAAARTPTVNVGSRQRGRERDGRGVVDVEESTAAIRRGIRRALSLRPIRRRRSVYGEGRAGPRIAELLARVPLEATFLHKLNAF